MQPSDPPRGNLCHPCTTACMQVYKHASKRVRANTSSVFHRRHWLKLTVPRRLRPLHNSSHLASFEFGTNTTTAESANCQRPHSPFKAAPPQPNTKNTYPKPCRRASANLWAFVVALKSRGHASLSRPSFNQFLHAIDPDEKHQRAYDGFTLC